ncbi:UNVERIFIED_CONTAM: hypothetical protein K2H54_039007 [Gekko kuhli]
MHLIQPVPPSEEVDFLLEVWTRILQDCTGVEALSEWAGVYQERLGGKCHHTSPGLLLTFPGPFEETKVMVCFTPHSLPVKGLASCAKQLNPTSVIVEEHKEMDSGWRNERLRNVPRLSCTIMRARTILFF